MSTTPWRTCPCRRTGACGIANSSPHLTVTDGRPATSWLRRTQRRLNDEDSARFAATAHRQPFARSGVEVRVADSDEERLIKPISPRQFELYALSLERGPNF